MFMLKEIIMKMTSKLRIIFIILFSISMLFNGIFVYTYKNKTEDIGKFKQKISECYDKLENERIKCRSLVEKLKLEIKKNKDICDKLIKENKKLQDKINEILNL